MRVLRPALFALLLVLPVLGGARGVRPRAPQTRGEDRDQVSSSVSTTAGGSTSTASTTPSRTSPSGSSISSGASGSREPSASTRSISASTSTDSSSTASTVPSGTPTAVNGASPTPLATTSPRPQSNGLPLPPRITPGLAVAGVILLATGMAYALIGIKSKWLHIPLSAAFLASLAVTVLIVYVMNVPVRDGIQGAFVVAAVITGIIFAVLSMVFPEITEGLGCLLGGFCLAMWLLVLKPGGLLTSSTSKAIFISVFCVGIWGLSFSHYTRPYGLIASTSFAGGTAVILGIDCFTRAGLKEFWLYIWALNNDLFPIDTDTYPHTRGIRVEIAGIVFIGLLGVISQMKMWKIVRDRRQRKAAERLERERDAEEAEAAIGRKIEDENIQERQEWEAVYGDRRSSDAKARHAASEDDDGESVRKHSVGAIELRELPKVHVEGLYDPTNDDRISLTDMTARQTHDEAKEVEREAARLSVPPPPPVIPLPFTIPSLEEPDAIRETSSVSARAEIEQDLLGKPGESLKTSGSKRLSPGTGTIPITSPSEEALLEPSIEDDVASSVAATIDDLSDNESDTADDASPMVATESPHTELVLLIEDDLEGKRALEDEDEKPPELIELPASPLEAVSGSTIGQNANPFDEYYAFKCEPADTKVRGDASTSSSSDTSITGDGREPALAPNNEGHRKRSNGKRKRGADAGKTEPNEQHPSPESPASESTTSPSDSDASASPSATAAKLSRRILKDHLPHRVSKVLLRYRTNEWAKHVTVADQPELEPLEPTEDGVSLVDASVELSSQRDGRDPHSRVTGQTEAPGPDKIPGEPTPAQSTSSLSSDSQQATEKNERLPKTSSTPSLQQYINRSRAGSLASLEGGGSAAASVRSIPQSIAAATRAIRSSSSPMPQASSLGLSNPRLYGYRTISQPLNSSSNLGNTLISQRESLIHNRFGPRSSTQLTPVLELDNPLHPNDSISISGSRRSTVGDDTASLKQRAESIRGLPSQQGLRYPSPGPNQVSNLYLPKRNSDLEMGKRDAMMMHWRQSLRQHSIHSQQPRPTLDARGEELHQDRQQRLSVTRQNPDPRAQYDTMLDERMRKSDMLELHRMAMKKMQATANVHA
ncbi:MAG: hypothetical protein M1823_004123 [Watsoniomyces obsoletus]|nr:MAG: hypothetical protein M1823_004123 [Watsoniomyces obsoletus]